MFLINEGSITTHEPSLPTCLASTAALHQVLMESALFVQRRATPTLLAACDANRDYAALIVGHSLGAGVAALLGLLFREHALLRRRHALRVFAFASPCVASAEFGRRAVGDDFIVSVALSTDVVMRLSLDPLRKC